MPVCVTSSEDLLSAKLAATEEKGRKKAKGSDREFARSFEDQLLLTLMRLRLGKLLQELVYTFGISESTAWRIFTMWIHYLYLRLGKIPIWLYNRADQSMTCYMYTGQTKTMFFQ